jgi:hypothetical protein
VALSSSDEGLVEVPAEVVVPAGARSVSIPVTAQVVPETTRVTITGEANGMTRSATLVLMGVR